MTKPIIINGVDVSKCCYFERENAPYCCTLYENECDAQNCYFQQLKRKERELQEAMDNYVQATNYYEDKLAQIKRIIEGV